jgi:hypothetical protein
VTIVAWVRSTEEESARGGCAFRAGVTRTSIAAKARPAYVRHFISVMAAYDEPAVPIHKAR